MSQSQMSYHVGALATALLAIGLANPSQAATSESTDNLAGAPASTCGALASKRFSFLVQGMYDTGYNALPFVEAGRLVFDASGPTGTSSSYVNGPGEVASFPITTFTCADLSLPKGFAQLSFADGRSYQLVPNNAVSQLKMIRVDTNYFAGGEARLSTDWSTLPAQACSLLAGKNYVSYLLGSVVVTTPTSGGYSAFADLWSFTTTPGRLSGVWEIGVNTPRYHAEAGTRLDCTPYDDGSALVTWTTPKGNFENSVLVYPNADGSSAAVVSTIPGQGAGGWLMKR